MATLRTTTDLLLQQTTGRTLNQFILDHYAHGGDIHSIQAALIIATGQVYDRRTVKAWVTDATM